MKHYWESSSYIIMVYTVSINIDLNCSIMPLLEHSTLTGHITEEVKAGLYLEIFGWGGGGEHA